VRRANAPYESGDRTGKYNKYDLVVVEVRMPDAPSTDPYLNGLLQGYRDTEVSELQQYFWSGKQEPTIVWRTA